MAADLITVNNFFALYERNKHHQAWGNYRANSDIYRPRNLSIFRFYA